MPLTYAGIRAVGFDLDGTLIDTIPDLATAINAMLERLGRSPLTPARIRTLVGDGAESLVERALASSRAAGTPEPALREALRLFKAAYSGQLYRDSRLYPEVTATLTALRAAGLALCCVTNKDDALAQPVMEAAGLTAHFAFTIGTRIREDRKPGPAMLLRACERLGVQPAQLLYVGDSRIDMEAAHAAGAAGIAVSYGYDERVHEGAGSPAALIDSLGELLGLDGLLERRS